MKKKGLCVRIQQAFARELSWRKKLNRRPNYHVVAIGVSKRGNVIGVATNTCTDTPRQFEHHAEGRLMMKYGNKISKILLARVGRSGKQRPIDPCDMCLKQAEKRGIIIEEIRLD